MWDLLCIINFMKLILRYQTPQNLNLIEILNSSVSLCFYANNRIKSTSNSLTWTSAWILSLRTLQTFFRFTHVDLSMDFYLSELFFSFSKQFVSKMISISPPWSSEVVFLKWNFHIIIKFAHYKMCYLRSTGKDKHVCYI